MYYGAIDEKFTTAYKIFCRKSLDGNLHPYTTVTTRYFHH